MTRKASIDHIVFIGISILTLSGLLMVYSASLVAATQNGIPFHFFLHQSIYAGLGFTLMLLAMFIDYHIWLKPRVIIMLAILSALCLLLVYSQAPIKGAHRGLRLGSLGSFQPSEGVKLAVLFYSASFLQKYRLDVKQSFSPLLRFLVCTGFFAGLICFEPDLGQALCILIIVAILLFIAGLDWKFVWGAILASFPAFYLFVWRVPFRHRRVLDWWDALRDPLNAGHQIVQATIAFGHGGIIGMGLAKSGQKLAFLPEAPTDFIFGVIGEEFGLIGTMLLAAVFLAYLFYGVKISLRAPDLGGFYLGIGIALMVVLSAFINMSTALAIMPAKGCTLPFISRGGSSLLVSLMATGILLNISSQKKLED
jgi:cell division protein FtsW